MCGIKSSEGKFDTCKFFILFSLFAIPFLIALEVIIQNNSNKFHFWFKYSVLFFLILFLFLFFISIIHMIVKKRIFNKHNVVHKFGVLFVVISYVLEIFSVINLVYYNEDFKRWLISSSIGSIHYKHIATSIYDEDTINEVIDSSFVDISEDIIPFEDIFYDDEIYANKYEEEILEREEGTLYKIIKVSGTTIGASYHYEGYMAVIYDPSKVRLAKSSGAGTFDGAYGETLSTISRKNDAIIAMNAGGFYDPDWNSNGGIPHGDVFINGILDSTYVRGMGDGGIIGFDKNHQLILSNMSTEEAIERGIRDAVDWGPFLIVDGNNQFKNVDYYTWACARTAIGQRADGIVLMLVIDGLQDHSKGASYADMAYIMEKYGAINAANLDGGTSTSMTVNHSYINSPWNGYVKTYRWLPNAWVVVE